LKFLSGGLLLVTQCDDLFDGILYAVGDGEVKTRMAQHALPLLDVRTFEAHDDRDLNLSPRPRHCLMCRAKKSREAYDMLTAATEQIEAEQTKRVPESLKNKHFPSRALEQVVSDASSSFVGQLTYVFIRFFD
jgi:hypothetical protein